MLLDTDKALKHREHSPSRIPRIRRTSPLYVEWPDNSKKHTKQQNVQNKQPRRLKWVNGAVHQLTKAVHNNKKRGTTQKKKRSPSYSETTTGETEPPVKFKNDGIDIYSLKDIGCDEVPPNVPRRRHRPPAVTALRSVASRFTRKRTNPVKEFDTCSSVPMDLDTPSSVRSLEDPVFPETKPVQRTQLISSIFLDLSEEDNAIAEATLPEIEGLPRPIPPKPLSQDLFGDSYDGSDPPHSGFCYDGSPSNSSLAEGPLSDLSNLIADHAIVANIISQDEIHPIPAKPFLERDEESILDKLHEEAINLEHQRAIAEFLGVTTNIERCDNVERFDDIERCDHFEQHKNVKGCNNVEQYNNVEIQYNDVERCNNVESFNNVERCSNVQYENVERYNNVEASNLDNRFEQGNIEIIKSSTKTPEGSSRDMSFQSSNCGSGSIQKRCAGDSCVEEDVEAEVDEEGDVRTRDNEEENLLQKRIEELEEDTCI